MITREMLNRFFGEDPRMLREMELLLQSVDSSAEGLATAATATEKLQDASFIVLAGNDASTNERVLSLGRGLSGDDDGSTLRLRTSDAVPIINGGFPVNFTVAGISSVQLPLSGTLATRENPETLERKTLDEPKISSLGNYANDAAAAAGGVPVEGIYRNGSVLMVRVA